MTLVADVAFDAPLPRPFSYRVAEGWKPVPGQRVLAPLRGAERTGVIVAVREDTDERLKPLTRLVDAEPLLDDVQLGLAHWIAAESLSPFGSTCLALLPPPDIAADEEIRGRAERSPTPPARRSGAELLIGAGRESKLLERVSTGGPALVLTADVESAGRWAQRLAKLERVVRLDSGVPDAERAAAWSQLSRGAARVAVGTRSALLAPLPHGGTVALVDEHEPAHKPPGQPRMHARDVVLERATRQGLSALLTAATPSVEMWWRATSGRARLDAPPPAPWPEVSVADARGIARREALTPALARAIREALAAGRRVFLGVTRLTSALGCTECGRIVACERCAISLAYSPAGRTLGCRFCGATVPLPETCAGCRGRRLAPFGWGTERVEHAVRRRFARARIARYDPDAMRGGKADAQRAAALAAEIIIGTRGALRLFGPASLGLAGFVSPDQLLGLPDFRAAERAFALLWAATERVRPDGAVIIQSQNPSHLVLGAVARQDLGAFYGPELKFRAELGYPPFRRLAIVTVTAPDAGEAQRVAEAAAHALAGVPALTVYPPSADRRQRAWRIVVKGQANLPSLLAAALGDRAGASGRRSRGIIDVEVDPVEWPF